MVLLTLARFSVRMEHIIARYRSINKALLVIWREGLESQRTCSDGVNRKGQSLAELFTEVVVRCGWGHA